MCFLIQISCSTREQRRRYVYIHPRVGRARRSILDCWERMRKAPFMERSRAEEFDASGLSLKTSTSSPSSPTRRQRRSLVKLEKNPPQPLRTVLLSILLLPLVLLFLLLLCLPSSCHHLRQRPSPQTVLLLLLFLLPLSLPHHPLLLFRLALSLLLVEALRKR